MVRVKKIFRGDFYEGEWENDLPNGFGTLQYLSGCSYKGEFKDGKPHGHGKFLLAYGGEYVGEYNRGLQHGKGRYVFSNGAVYIGEFQNDKMHGKGRLKANGMVYDAIWHQGKMNDTIKVTHGDGTVSTNDTKSTNRSSL